MTTIGAAELTGHPFISSNSERLRGVDERLTLGDIWRGWNREAEPASRPDLAIDPHPSAVCLDDRFADRESKPDASKVRCPRLPEPIEEVLAVLG